MHVIHTRLTSPAPLAVVHAWKTALEADVASVPDGGEFALLVDLRGYDAAADPEAHREMRVVVPLLLARHGLRTAVLDLFPEATIEVTQQRGVVCRAAAYVHHEAAKMATYNERIATARERFFTERKEAEAWLAGF